MKIGNCQKCGAECEPTREKYDGKTELGLSIPVTVHTCPKCNTKHVICPDCDGNRFKIKYNSPSIFEDVEDCRTCFGMGTIKIEKEII